MNVKRLSLIGAVLVGPVAIGAPAAVAQEGGTSSIGPRSTAWSLPASSLSCRVPKVVGLQLLVAKKVLRRARCVLGTVKRRYSKRFSWGIIITQTPRARTQLTVGGSVNVVVSRGRAP